MEDTVVAFVSETKKMHESYQEQVLKLEKQRKGAFDSLASLDFVTSNWSTNEDILSLQKVRTNISNFIESLNSEITATESIKKEIQERQEIIKKVISILIDLYRDLTIVEDVSCSEKKSLYQFDSEIVQSIFQAQPESLYNQNQFQSSS